MGVMQRLYDSFWMKIGKTEKVYPVQIKKHRLKAGEIVFDGIDRGRTLKDSETGEKRFEIYGEPFAEGIVNYEDFEKSSDGDWVSVLMINRDKFVPLNIQYNVDKETYLDEEEMEKFDIEENALEYTLSVASFLEWADKHIEQSWKITETDSEKWWQSSAAQSAALFIGAGLFFVLLGVARGEFYVKPLAEQMSALETALRESGQAALGPGG